MNFIKAKLLRYALAVSVLGAVLSGCVGPGGGGGGGQTTNSIPDPGLNPDMLHSGDKVTIVFSDSPMAPQNHEQQIRSDGKITPPLVGEVLAEGKTKAQLEAELQKLYVPGYFRRLTITVKTEQRYFFVTGEVRVSNKYEYTGEMTVLKAIAGAGGFTDFANKKTVQITRANKAVIRVNCVDAIGKPQLDLPIYPGDQILVRRRSL